MLLRYHEAANLRTKKVIFEDVFRTRDSCTLEQMKELSSRRNLGEVSINKSDSNQLILQRLEDYLPILENFVIHIDSISNSSNVRKWVNDLKIQWTSTLISPHAIRFGGPKYFCINDLHFEVAMNLFLYGSVLREIAYESVETEAVSLFRKAAGVFKYLFETVLPPLQSSFPQERTPEVFSSLSSIMSFICLADAQAIFLKKAEEKGSSASLLSKLHYGIFLILNDAISILKSRAGELKDLPKGLEEFISTCQALHLLRSRIHFSEQLRAQNRLGVSIAVLRYAIADAKKVRLSRQDDSWRSIASLEIENALKNLKKAEMENDLVFHDKVVDPLVDPLPALEEKRVITHMPYDPQKWERMLVFDT